MNEQIDSGIRFAHLMAARRAGTISEEDGSRLDEWLVLHPEFHQVYEEVMAWNGEEEDTSVSAEEAWKEFSRRYALGECRGAAVSLWRRLSVACGVAVLVGVGLLLLRRETAEVMPAAVPVVEKLAEAHLEMEDGRVVSLGKDAGERVEVEGMAIHRERAEVDYRAQVGKPAEGAVAFHAVSVPKYGEYSVCLSDGTMVKINSGSRLRYPVRFAGDVREVWLEGEAFFEVARDTAARFVVHTGRMDVKVLGTVFNVEAWPSSEVARVTLVSGSVEAERGDAAVCLLPGEQAIACSGGGELVVRRVDTRAVTAWVRGMFYFDEERLEDILAYLADWYGFRPEYVRPYAKGQRFSVELRRYGNVDDVLRFIEETGVVRFERRGTLVKVY